MLSLPTISSADERLVNAVPAGEGKSVLSLSVHYIILYIILYYIIISSIYIIIIADERLVGALRGAGRGGQGRAGAHRGAAGKAPPPGNIYIYIYIMQWL